MDHHGYVYVADTGNHAIRMISPSGEVSTITGTGSPGDGDGEGVAQFSSPTDVAVWRDWAWWPYPNPIDPDSFLYRNGNGTLALFVTDTANHRIRKITGEVEVHPESGQKVWNNVQIECFSGRCGNNPEPGLADGKKDTARFDSPLGVTVSSAGNVYVADTNNGLIRMIDQFGTVTTIAGHHRFNYPSDVALDSNEDYVIVTDRHRIHRVNLNDNTDTVTTLAGGDNEGDRDGDGVESTLNNPTSITVSGDGVAYVADAASCRIRRVSTAASLAQQVCTIDSLVSVIRPNGCSSYNNPIDEYGLAATPVEGNIHYNYQFKDEFDIGLGHDFIGKTLKSCVGSPPISRLDKKRWNETVSSYPFNLNLVIDDNRTHVREDPNDGTRITVECNSICDIESSNDIFYAADISGLGSANVYPEEKSICAAAMNEGILDESGHGIVDVTIISEERLRGQIDTAEAHQFFVVSKSTQDARLQTISGAPTTLRGQSCGYRDSFPPQDSKVRVVGALLSLFVTYCLL